MADFEAAIAAALVSDSFTGTCETQLDAEVDVAGVNVGDSPAKNNASGISSTILAAAIGGAIGGVILLAGMIGLAVYCCKKNENEAPKPILLWLLDLIYW